MTTERQRQVTDTQLTDKSLLYFFTKLITILNFDFTNL